MGFKVKEYLIVGPVLRYNRINLLNGSFGVNKSFNSYGGGGFMEMHFAKILFLGFEVNAVNSPFKFTEVFSGSIDLNKELWTINAFISVGVSISVKNQFRLNGCISYDVINRGNSPFRRLSISGDSGPVSSTGCTSPPSLLKVLCSREILGHGS